MGGCVHWGLACDLAVMAAQQWSVPWCWPCVDRVSMQGEQQGMEDCFVGSRAWS